MFDIIIPHYGKQELLDNCINSIQANTQHPYQLIVIDNNQQNYGFAGSVNRGVAQGNGTYIVLLNNDTVVPPTWLDNLLSVLNMDRKIAVVGPLSTASTQWQGIDNVAKWLQKPLPAPEFIVSDKVRFPSRPAFWCALIPRTVWNDVGSLDEQFFMYGEDDDWCLRAQEKGYKWALDLSTLVYHAHRSNYNLETQQHHHESRQKFRIKWGERGKKNGWL